MLAAVVMGGEKVVRRGKEYQCGRLDLDLVLDYGCCVAGGVFGLRSKS